MFDFDDPKNWSALLIGILLMALGLIPLLNGWGIIGFTLPAFLTTIVPKIALYLIAGAGVYLLIDSFMEDDTTRIISILVALAVVAIGILGILGFKIPFLGETLYNILFVIEGLFLFIAAFAMF